MTLSKSNNGDQQSDLNSRLFKSESALDKDCDLNPTIGYQQQSNSSEVVKIPLLEEKLQVNRRKRKVGEVIIRKQVETRTIKIPLKKEKLIIERIGTNPKRLTEVIIGEETINGFKYDELKDAENLRITTSHFFELHTAQELLDAIAQLSSAANTRVRLEIVTNCSEHQIEHQHICDRFQ